MGQAKYVKEIEEKIWQNTKRLKSCKRHTFVKNEESQTYMARYMCKNCGGLVRENEKVYYELGLRHGQR